MAQTKGVYKTMLDTDPSTGKQYPPGAVIFGKTEHMYDYRITTTGDDNAGTILLGDIKAGKRCIGGIFKHGAMGASVTMKVGTAADDDAFVKSRSVASAGVVLFDGDGVGAVHAAGPMIVTIGGADPAADIRLEVTGLFTGG